MLRGPSKSPRRNAAGLASSLGASIQFLFLGNLFGLMLAPVEIQESTFGLFVVQAEWNELC